MHVQRSAWALAAVASMMAANLHIAIEPINFGSRKIERHLESSGTRTKLLVTAELHSRFYFITMASAATTIEEENKIRLSINKYAAKHVLILSLSLSA